VSALAAVEWSDGIVPPRRDPEIERAFRQAFGLVPPSTGYYANCPWLAFSMANANYRSGQLVALAPELADLVFLAVSQDNSCRFCYAAVRSTLRILGFDEARIRRTEETASTTETDPRESAALDFARRFSRANPPAGPEDRERLRGAGFRGDEIRELAYMAGYSVLGNRTTTLPAVPPQALEGLPDRLAVRIVRPLLARVLRFRTRTGQAEPLPEELRSVPFAHVPLALEGLPTARIQAEFLKRCFDAGPLSPRTKALVFAVIARGLGSRRVEEEAKQLARAQGIGSEPLEEALAHLASPALDATESAVLPFARETIRVRPVEIQRRARKLRETLDPEAFMDLVGVISLANGIGRLSHFLEAP
jgi:AhpD family alkylhydroperoxidase